MRRKFEFSIGEFYHVYNRGTEKRLIFSDGNDYNRFITLLYLCNSSKPVNINNYFREGLSFTELIVNVDTGDSIVDIGAYCLMPNHFHLLLKEKTENGISQFMKKLLTAYSMYFNKKHKRTGRLFEGPFLAKHLDTDNYLKYIISYIHLNPIKLIDSSWKERGIIDYLRAKQHLADYLYSSYLDYIGKHRKEGKILAREKFPEYFRNFKDFDQFINEWLSHPAKDSPLQDVI